MVAIVTADREQTCDPGPRYWTREEYYRAAEAGIFRPEERLELIEGEIFRKVTPQGTPHATGMWLSAQALQDAFGTGYAVRTQSPMATDNFTEPEPDVMVVPGGPRDYEDHHPRPAEVLLLVEVSDSTLAFDRKRKARLYARIGIQEYWILNLPDRRLEVHRQPFPDGSWGSIHNYAETDIVTPLAAPDAMIRVTDLLPRPRPGVEDTPTA